MSHAPQSLFIVELDIPYPPRFRWLVRIGIGVVKEMTASGPFASDATTEFLPDPGLPLFRIRDIGRCRFRKGYTHIAGSELWIVPPVARSFWNIIIFVRVTGYSRQLAQDVTTRRSAG
jgi:hypothetical protein